MKYRYREPHELKESGIEWIGKIPKEWEVKKLKYVSELNARKLSENEDPDFEINYVDIGNVNSNGKIEEIQVFRFENAPSRARRIIKNGDTIVSTVRTYLKAIAYFEKAEENLICSTGFAVFSPHHDKFVKKYFYYLISSDKYINEIVRNSVGVSYPAINASQIADFNCFLPKIEQQSLISSFLDRKCAEFDGIVEKKQSIILKLEEAKKSLISEVVTGKVRIENGKILPRKEEEMKESGIEWIGKIPKEWEVKKIKYLFSLRNERNHLEMDEVQVLSLYTDYGVRKQEDVEFKTGNKVQTVEEYKVVYPDDIIVNIILAWMGSIGVSDFSGVISPAYDIYKPKENICSRYYHYLFRTHKFAGECFKYGRGIMMMRWRTYSDEFRSIYTTLPKESEQPIVASFLDKKTEEIDSVITKIRDQIEKIKKAKQSLISEAVTGKIEVMEEK